MSSFLETDVRTVVLRTLSKRLTPVMMRYALVAKELVDELVHLSTDYMAMTQPRIYIEH